MIIPKKITNDELLFLNISALIKIKYVYIEVCVVDAHNILKFLIYFQHLIKKFQICPHSLDIFINAQTSQKMAGPDIYK
jgi:hypothetical protein